MEIRHRLWQNKESSGLGIRGTGTIANHLRRQGMWHKVVMT